MSMKRLWKSLLNSEIAYSDFISKLESVINIVAPIKTVCIRNNTSEWFDGDITKNIHTRDKLCKMFKSTKLHFDEDTYKEAQKAVQSSVPKKKNTFLEQKLKTHCKF